MRPGLLLLLFVSLGCPLCAFAALWEPPRHVGVQYLVHFADLPILYPGTLTRQNSSHDPTGANDDGFACNHWAYSDGEHVLLDEVGPGCIETIWCTSPPLANIKIYFDNEPVARVNLSILDFFSGTVPPFLAPLVGNDHVSSGGFYCKVPMVFAQRVRIAFTGTPCFWHVLWHRYPAGTPVTTFTPTLDVSQAVALYRAVGADPKPTAGNQVVSGTANPGAGATAVLLERTQAGTIQAIRLDPSPANEAVLTGVWLRITFDGADPPQVEAPLGLFFGCGAAETNVRALPVGMSTSSGYYCYFPMPYWETARVELVNRSAVPVTVPFQVEYTNAKPDEHAAYFCAQYRRENPTGPNDYLFLDVSGTGHYVGASLMFAGPADLYFLEGDERFYIDGSYTPQIHGTGTEDYLHAGWYFGKGPFSLPTHGMTRQDTVGSQVRFCAYRFHLGDRVPFTSRLVAGIEHGPVNDRTGDYSSVAYYYHRPALTSYACDLLNIGDSASESQHAYNVVGQTWSGSLTSAYDGDGGTFTDSGRQFNGSSQFRLSLPQPHIGAILRRRMDHAAGRQQALVTLDGLALHRWETNDQNPSRRWYDTEVFLPPTLLSGKTTTTVQITSSNWSEFRYWALGLAATDAPQQWEAEERNPTGSSGRDLLRIGRNEPYWTWGGRAIAEYQAVGVNDWISWSVPITGPGWYCVWPVFARRDGYALVQVSIDGAPAGEPVNLHALGSHQGPFAGPARLLYTENAHCTIRLEVVGKDAQSPGHLIGIDALCVSRVTHPGTPTPATPTATRTPTMTATPPLGTGTPLAVPNGDFEGGAFPDPDSERQRPESWGCGSAPTGSWSGVPHPPRPPKHKVEVNWNQRNGQKCFNMRDLTGPGQAYVIYTAPISVSSGMWVSAQAWFRNYKDTGNPGNCACSIGIHPTGGTDPSGVVWGMASTAENVYTPLQATAGATGSQVRIFLRVNTQAGFVDSVLWDDVTTAIHTAPPPTATPPSNTPTPTAAPHGRVWLELD